MLPQALVELLADIFKKLVMLVAMVGGIAAVIALLQGFVDQHDAIRRVLKICGYVVTALSVSFILYIIVVTVSPHASPWTYFRKLSEPSIYQQPAQIPTETNNNFMALPFALGLKAKSGLITIGKLVGIEVL